jgi:hypothetical protein
MNSIERIDIEADKTSWNGNLIQSQTVSFAGTPIAGTLSQKYIYFTMTDQTIIQIDRNNPDMESAVTRSISLGVGSLNCMGVDQGNGYLFIGSSYGIAFKLHLVDLSLVNVMFISGYSLQTVVVDPISGVTFWGTSSVANQGSTEIVRVNPDVFTVSDMLIVGTDNVLSGLLLGNNVYFVSSPQLVNNPQIPVFIKMKISGNYNLPEFVNNVSSLRKF